MTEQEALEFLVTQGVDNETALLAFNDITGGRPKLLLTFVKDIRRAHNYQGILFTILFTYLTGSQINYVISPSTVLW